VSARQLAWRELEVKPTLGLASQWRRNHNGYSLMPMNILKWFRPGEHVCPWWLAYSFDNPLRSLVHDPEALFGDLIREGQTVLDLGCGMGHFSIGMAKLVGESGTVIAVDLQDEMLERVRRRTERAGLSNRLVTHLSEPGRIGLDASVDFALAFWMVHEVPDQTALFNELLALLTPAAKLLIAEPKIHVSELSFRETEAKAQSIGFRIVARPRIKLSRSALLARC
jgi:SAM-dependent methyltransferase